MTSGKGLLHVFYRIYYILQIPCCGGCISLFFEQHDPDLLFSTPHVPVQLLCYLLFPSIYLQSFLPMYVTIPLGKEI